MKITSIKNNGHDLTRFIVNFVFVAPNSSSGYTTKYNSNAKTKEEAIVEALNEMLSEGREWPLAGVFVYELSLTL